MRSFTLACAALAATLGCAAANAQTCASPIPVATDVLPLAMQGDSCMSADNISTYDGGSVYAPGSDVVYRVYGNRMLHGATPGLQFTVLPGPWFDPVMFACQQCGAVSTCIAAVDHSGEGGIESMIVDSQPAAYYLMVDSLWESHAIQGCGNYSLHVSRTH
jgi:hypothetical protein